MAPAPSDKFLLEGEHLDYQTRRHWSILLRPALWAALSLLVLSILFGITGSNVVTGAGGLGVLYLWVRLSWLIADWRLANLYLTDWRLFEISGIVTKRIAAMPLRKITDLTYEISPLGRLLGYGRFIIETAGQDQAFSRLDHIPQPRRLYEVLSHLTLHGEPPPDETGAGPAPTGRPGRAGRLLAWVRASVADGNGTGAGRRGTCAARTAGIATGVGRVGVREDEGPSDPPKPQPPKPQKGSSWPQASPPSPTPPSTRRSAAPRGRSSSTSGPSGAGRAR